MKTKWLKVKIPIELTKFIDILNENQYRLESKNGFELIDFNKTELHAKFIEKVISKEVIIDPFGNSNEIEITRYLIINFSIYKINSNSYFLIVESPPRSLKCLTDKLYKIIGFGIFFSNLEINIIYFIKNIQEKYGFSSTKINSLKIGNIYLSKKTTGVIDLNPPSNFFYTPPSTNRGNFFKDSGSFWLG